VSNSAILEQVAQIMIFEWQQNAGIMNYDISISNRSVENVTKFKQLEMTLTNQHFIHEEIKIILNSGSACSHSKNIVFPSDNLKKIKINGVRNYNFACFLCGCENWFAVLVV
jgi:hypothetical protein